MICPFCGREMIPGFVQSARKVFFTQEKHSWWFVPDTEDVLLTRHNMTGPTCTAYHCPDCKKVIADYGNKQT